MFGNLNKTDTQMRNQDEACLLRKKFSKNSVTSTKFFDSTEDLPEGSSHSTGSNSSKLLKEYKGDTDNSVHNRNSYICDKRIALLDTDSEKVESDNAVNSVSEKQVNTIATDSYILQSETVDNNENNLNTNIGTENKDITKTDITKTDITKTDITKTDISKTDISKTDISKTDISKTDITNSSIPIEATSCYTINADTNLNGYVNKPYYQLNNSTYSSIYSPTYNNSVIPPSVQVGETCLNNYTCPPISYSSNSYSPSSYPQIYSQQNLYPLPKETFTAHSVHNENNYNYINNNLNTYPRPNSNNHTSTTTFNTHQDKTYDIPSFPSTTVAHITKEGFTPVNISDHGFKKINNFQNVFFNSNHIVEKNSSNDFIYNKSATILGSNNIDTLNYKQSNINLYTPNNMVNCVSENKSMPISPHSLRNYNAMDINKNMIPDNKGNADEYLNSIGRTVNGTITETVNQIESVNKPFFPERSPQKRISSEPKVANDHLLNAHTSVNISEKISSEPDYSRATHSSHVVDKRFVHEGFDTIKIPKYREVEIVEKIVEVPVIHKVNKYVDKYEIKQVEKIVKKPINKYIETKIEVPEFHYQDKVIEVPEMHEIVKIVEKPEIKERIIYKNIIETKIIPKYIEVPVVKIVDKYEEYDDIQEVVKTVPIKKIVEIPTEVIKKVKVPVNKIVEQANYVPVIKYRDVPIEKIRYVPKIETVELEKIIPKVIDVHVPVKVPKIEIIDKPYYVNKYVDKYVNVPVSKRYTPIYKCEGKKIVEIPIHKPYIVTHDTIVPKNISSGIHNGPRSVQANPVDINTFSSQKQKQLYDMVNKNNFNLQRSISMDNFTQPKNDLCSNTYHNTNPNFHNSVINENSFTNPLNMKSSSIQSVRNYYTDMDNSNHINRPCDLKFTSSLNASNNINNQNSNSFNNINKHIRNAPNSTNNRFYSNGITKPTQAFESPKSYRKYTSRSTCSFPDVTENNYFMSGSNPSNLSRNMSNNSNVMNSNNCGNRFMRSRSPSVYSEEISAYAVEHVGQQSKFMDSNVTTGSRYNMDDNMSANNNSFNGSFNNFFPDNKRRTSFM